MLELSEHFNALDDSIRLHEHVMPGCIEQSDLLTVKEKLLQSEVVAFVQHVLDNLSSMAGASVALALSSMSIYDTEDVREG